MSDEPDSPDVVDLTQDDARWTDEREKQDPPKEVEEMTPEEIREEYPRRAEDIIELLKDDEESKVAEVLNDS